MPDARPLQSLLTTTEVASRLGIARKTLENWRVEGYGPPYLKIRKYVRYRPEDVDAWLASRERQHTSDPGPTVIPFRQKDRPGYAK